MKSYTKAWETAGTAWSAVLDVLAKEAQSRAQQLQLSSVHVSRERWDAPEVQLRWQKADDVSGAVTLLVGSPATLEESQSYPVSLSGSAWFDQAGERHWKWQDLGTVTLSVMAQPDGALLTVKDAGGVGAALDEAIKKVQGWWKNQLDHVDPLPPPPPGLQPSDIHVADNGTVTIHRTAERP